MTLPPAQERVLDAMAESLRASEPRLASMFAIFTRLTRNEAAPRREQLPARSLRRIRKPRLHRGRVRGSGLRAQHKAFWLHVLIASPLAIALVVVGLVLGFGKHTASPGCSTLPGVHTTAAHRPHGAKCSYQPGWQSGMFGK
jgi:hypothetical protein